MSVILIGGGSRSGKSRFALKLARGNEGRRLFIATARPLDAEMAARIACHQRERGPGFETLEEPLDVAAALQQPFSAAVVDCLTLWLANLMEADRDVAQETRLLIQAAQSASGTVIFVTNEVGCGIVPENELARRFRDLAGELNQRIAAAADQVWFMVFGCPLRLK